MCLILHHIQKLSKVCQDVMNDKIEKFVGMEFTLVCILLCVKAFNQLMFHFEREYQFDIVLFV
ncbi:hypothetical protein KUTeg_001760 [Tegillarca granosa]|uniref:Uncharacterized protein n=1 Tax=Tegillarca granosa TaxID=220873 RepID=A0ABQ9FWS3_TEGGR|nr:hypothetical protein KUTeg_001760 [Tegillarca granosa]